MSEPEKSWSCAKCGVPLEKAKIVFHYMGRSFGHEVPACPRCGKVFISKELAQGKMAQVEALMEDK